MHACLFCLKKACAHLAFDNTIDTVLLNVTAE